MGGFRFVGFEENIYPNAPICTEENTKDFNML